MLTIKNLRKKYPNSDRYSVDGLSLEVKEGEIFGFLGKNGAGKSTTIKCLAGILPYDEGEINICGYDLKKEPIKAKLHMGYVPDNHSVLEKLTGREYVNYVADIYKVDQKAREDMMDYYLDVFSLHFAVDKQIKSYSHGMKQKICLIAALIHQPKLWVLDEPMLGLDPQSMAEIVLQMQAHAAKGNSVFFSSHNLDLVKKLCHRVAIINDGKLIEVMDLVNNKASQDRLDETFYTATGMDREKILSILQLEDTRDNVFTLKHKEDAKDDKAEAKDE
ncbi:MAG TPA: ABC transporter ATP-binding protein [Clostridia bacterium]|nr:ABC transporter ATP-binding protein [Clostridia bacterium]